MNRIQYCVAVALLGSCWSNFTLVSNTYSAVVGPDKGSYYSTLIDESVKSPEPQDSQMRYPKRIKSVHRGSQYYTCLIDEAQSKCWAVNITGYAELTSKAFDNSGKSTPLAQGVFGKTFTIQDVFLLAKLSAQDKLHIYPPEQVPQNPQFGNARQEQYLNLLADTNVRLSADQKSFGLDISALYRFNPFDSDKIGFIVGLNLPVRAVVRTLDLSFDDGSLYYAGYAQNVIQRETTLTQFHKDFIDVADFFKRAVLDPKGITFAGRQNLLGISDMSLFLIADFANLSCRVDGLQAGVNILLPTATKKESNVLWAADFGSGKPGLELFANIFLNWDNDMFNPLFHAAFGIGLEQRYKGQRVPQVKTQAEEGLLTDNSTLLVPVFRQYRTDPFSEVDTTVPQFADGTSSIKTRGGHLYSFGFGNYSYNIFKTDFRLGLFYDFMGQSTQKVFASSGSLDTAALEAHTKRRAHRIGWNFTYKFESLMELAIGSQHIIAGKNVEKANQAFLTFVAVF